MKATGKGFPALNSLRCRTAFGALAILLIAILCTFIPTGSTRTMFAESQRLSLQDAYGRLPLSFIKNEGQLGNAVKYYERGPGHSIFFIDNEIQFHFTTRGDHLTGGLENDPRQHLKDGAKARHGETARKISQVRLYPLRMQEGTSPEGIEPQEGKVNYFIGQDSSKWKTDIATYRSIVYREAYPGVDLKFYGSNECLEYDVIVKAGADPSQVKFGYSGIDNLSISENGDLHLLLPDGGTLTHKKPLAYQEIDGQRRDVEAVFTIEPLPGKVSGNADEAFAFGFKVAAYDSAYPLVIDPVLVYSTYLGGSSSDTGHAIAVDSSGYAYVTGRTYSTTFPTASSLDSSYGGSSDAFVTKLNQAGTALVYSTYLGGTGFDSANGITVDSSGNAYITGETTSSDFPTYNPYSSVIGSAGLSDAFVVKLSSSGSALTYATYLGGNSYDVGLGIAVDSSGVAYVTGETSSNNFPIVEGTAFQSTFGGGYADMFVTRFNTSGNSLTFSTYLGGSDADSGYGIAVDSSNIYVTGETASVNFPATGGAQGVYGGGDFDAFVLKIARSSLAMIYATYLGGSGADYGSGVAAGGDGTAYVVGTTSSTNFPLANAAQGTPGGGQDAFIAKVASDGNSLSFSSYLGGVGNDIGYAIAVDSKGNAYIAGKTSGNFPTTKAVQSVFGGSESDGFLARVDCADSKIAYATYLGGGGVDVARGIAVGAGGNVYTTGWTSSYNFPTTSGVFLQNNAGGYDVFVSKLNALLADFSATPTSGFYPLTVTFTDTSEGAVTSRLWSFGDGKTSTAQNPTNTYASSGIYTVSLTVTGTGGEDTKTRTGYIKVAVPEVTISATTPSISETGGSGLFTVTRSAYTSEALLVNYTVSGSATPGTDYAQLSGAVTIPQGSSSTTISVVPVADDFNDGDETVIVTLSTSTRYSIGASGAATVTIVDHDLPKVTVSASIASVSEKSSQWGLFVVSRAGLTTSALTVYYTVGGTAVVGTDYTGLSNSVTIPAGYTTASISVTPLWDQVYDGDKTVVLTLSENSLYSTATPKTATVTVVDSDLPMVTITAASPTIAENASQPGQFIFTHTGTTSLPLTVKFTIGGSAVNGVNYAGLTGLVTIPVNSASASVYLVPFQDGQFTGDLTVVLSLQSSSLYTIGSPNSATITIVEKDLPTVTINATQPNAKEASVTGQFTLSRTGSTSVPLTVSFTAGGTATPGVNYTALGGAFTIPADASSATITVQPLEESLYQGPTTVILVLNNSSLYKIGTANTATVTIADNDGPAVTIVATRPTVAEADTGKGQFTVTRSSHIDAALLVTYTVSGTATIGTDYVKLPGSVTIPPGYASGSILVNPLEDFVSDGDKTVAVTITGSEWYQIGAPSSATVTILDSDLPTVTIATTVSQVLETGVEAAQFAVTRSGATVSALTVNYATAGTAISGVDYTAPSGTVTIPAGSSSATISIMPLWDHLYDGNKTLTVILAGGSAYNVGSSYQASAVIVDQDVPTVSVSTSIPTVEEIASTYGRFLVTHSGITTLPVTVSYTVGGTATPGSDYATMTGTVTIPAGSSSAIIDVVPYVDSVPDDAETVVITLAGSALYTVGSPNSATVIIYEPGAPTVTIATSSVAMEGTTSGAFTVYRTKVTTAPLTVAYTTGGTAVPGQHYTTLPGFVTIPVGSDSAPIPVQAIENAVYEGPTDLVVTLLPSENYNLGTSTSATALVADNDGSILQIETIFAKRYAYETGPVAGQLKVYRPGGSTAGVVPVTFTLGGTATNGEDYNLLSGTIQIPDGEAYAIIEIVPIDDDLDEPLETVEVTLVPNGWYTVGSKASAEVSIVDNDIPKVSVVALDDNASESGSNTGTFRVIRRGVTTSTLVVYYDVGGTASNGGRYAKLNGNITIYPGSSYADIAVVPYNDTTYQGNETVTLTVLATELYHTEPPENATVTIYDNDNATVTISAPVGTVNENSTEPGVFRVSRNGNPAAAPALEVKYSVDGTAIYGTDYDASFSGTGTVVIPAGEASVDIEVFPINNETQEGTRTVILTLSPNPGVTIGTSKTAVVSIIDDEMPSVSIQAVDELASEDAGDSGTFRISRTGDLSAPLEVAYSVDGSAVPGTHYTALPASVTIPAEASYVDLTVSVIDDQIAQLDKKVIVTLSSTEDYYVGSPNKATVSIVDNEAPVISIAALRNATESGTKGQFQFSRVGNIHTPLVVPFTVGGTAVAGVNYKALPTQITFSKDQASKILQVTPIDDNKTTGNLTVVLTLSETANYQLGSSGSASISITDEDLPEVTIVATDAYAIEQGLHKGIFTISRTRSTDSALTVKYTVGGTAKSGVDYQSIKQTTTIPKGSASKTLNITPIDDNQTDVSRTVELTLKSDPVYLIGKPSAAVVNIADTSLPQVSMSAVDKIASVPGNTGKFKIRRLGPTAEALKVKYTIGGTAKNGTDYRKLSASATFAENKSSVMVTVTPLADGEVLSNESVILTLSAPDDGAYTLGSQKKGTVTILGTDLPVIDVVAKNSNASEDGPTSGTFTFSRTGKTLDALEIPFVLSGTATKNKDYQSIGSSVYIPIGASFVDVALMPKTDKLAEGSETVILTLKPSLNYKLGSSSATITITDK